MLFTFESYICGSIRFYSTDEPLQKDFYKMKKLLIPILILTALALGYEQSKDHPNVYISAGSFGVFMFLLYQLNTRIPHKNTNDKDLNDDHERR